MFQAFGALNLAKNSPQPFISLSLCVSAKTAQSKQKERAGEREGPVSGGAPKQHDIPPPFTFTGGKLAVVIFVFSGPFVDGVSSRLLMLFGTRVEGASHHKGRKA